MYVRMCAGCSPTQWDHGREGGDLTEDITKEELTSMSVSVCIREYDDVCVYV